MSDPMNTLAASTPEQALQAVVDYLQVAADQQRSLRHTTHLKGAKAIYEAQADFAEELRAHFGHVRLMPAPAPAVDPVALIQKLIVDECPSEFDEPRVKGRVEGMREALRVLQAAIGGGA